MPLLNSSMILSWMSSGCFSVVVEELDQGLEIAAGRLFGLCISCDRNEQKQENNHYVTHG